MKQTEFLFGLRVSTQDTLESLKKKLQALPEVKAVAVEEGVAGRPTMIVHVTFEDGEHAKRIHREVMNMIIANKGVAITEVTTRLTDIF